MDVLSETPPADAPASSREDKGVQPNRTALDTSILLHSSGLYTSRHHRLTGDVAVQMITARHLFRWR
jgi:hypothetical protein